MPLNTTQAHAILDAVLGDAHISAFPNTLYFALSTTTPTSTGTNVTEPTGNGYARVSVANTTAKWGTASNKQKANVDAITFPAATGAGWGTITYVVVYDASTAGNVVAWAAVTSPFSVFNGQQVSFAVGDFKFTVA